mgnify:FL=1
MRIGPRGQGVLEYSLLVAVIVAGLLLTQMYLRRATQGRLRSASESMGDAQYFPGHTTSEMNTTVVVNITTGVDGAVSSSTASETRTRNDNETVTVPSRE